MCGVTGFIDIRQNNKPYDSKKVIEKVDGTSKPFGTTTFPTEFFISCVS